jgi:hypothetical protein
MWTDGRIDMGELMRAFSQTFVENMTKRKQRKECRLEGRKEDRK